MKLLIALFFYLITGSFVQSQDLSLLKKEAERLEALPDEKAAFNKYKLIVKYDPKNLNALTKCSELCSRIGKREKDTKSRDSYYSAALQYATNAIKLYPGSDEANVAMGIAIGRTSLTKSGKEKIAAAKEIKQYAENALKINPKNFKAWHIIGKWNYEVSGLSMMERAASRVLYGGLPEASLKKAIIAYENAKALNPGFLLNYLELAKAYKKNNEKQKGVLLLRTLLTLPSKIEDDARIKNETASLLKNWQ
jgi:tetratricopeptide (TPR) repeat protein